MSKRPIIEITFWVNRADKAKIHPDPRHLASRLQYINGFANMVSVSQESGEVIVYAYAGYLDEIEKFVIVYLEDQRGITIDNIMRRARNDL